MKLFKYIAAVILFAWAAAVQGQDQLNRYLVDAAENNAGLKALFNDYLAALEKVPQVTALPDPQVSFGYFIQPVETRLGPQQFRISANQAFPWFGVLNAKGDVAAQAAKTKFEAFREAKAKLFNQVRTSYYNLYFNQKALAVMEENIHILKSIQKLVYARVEAGTTSAADEYRIEMDLNDLRNQQQLLADNYIALVVQFNNLLNTEEDVKIELPDDLWETGLEPGKKQLLDSIGSQNHQLLKIDYEKQVLSLQEEVEKLKSNPNLTIGMEYINIGKAVNNQPGKDAFVFPRIGVTIPLFRKKYDAILREVALLQTAKDYEREEKINWLESIFETGYKNYRDADRRIDLFRNQADLANKTLNILKTEYTTGGVGFEELLRIEKQLLGYNLELEKAKTDKQTAISFIKYLMGK